QSMITHPHLGLIVAVAAAGLLAALGAAVAQPPDNAAALAQYRAQRALAAHRHRRIIFNNDGDDHLLSGDTSREAFFALRTTPLLGSQVDAISYCTSRPFGMFLHRTAVGQAMTDRNAFGPARVNIVPDLLAQGTDPLRLMTDYGHRNGLEVFWSMRMNDTHDAGHTPTKPHYYFSDFKREHPEFLFGSPGKPPKYGSWTAVDYGQPEVRDFLFRVFEEVCRNVDVDGLEMDFFRHLVLFRTVADGAPATPEEREMMTALVRRLRAMTEVEGMRRGKPILLLVRAPDSVGYCQGMGLDLERWMAEGLMDIFVAGGDFQLNPWEVSTALGARHDVPVYCDLDPSVRYNMDKRFNRNAVETYRGRAMNAWSAGAAGLYVFNNFNPRDPLWWSIGDAREMLGKDKFYFVNVTGRSGYLRSSRALPDGDQHDHLPTLHPVTPMRLSPGGTLSFDLPVGEDFAAARAAGLTPKTTCYVSTSLKTAPELSLNGIRLTGTHDADDWFAYPVPPDNIRRGANEVRLARGPEPDAVGQWELDWQCAVEAPGPWGRDGLRGGTAAKMQDGALLIADRSTERGSYLYYSYPWNADPATQAVVELRARALAGRSGIIVCNGVAEEEVHVYPDRIGAAHARLSYAMDTAAAFHDYRIEIEQSDLRVYVDGQLALDGTGKFTSPASDGRNALYFGASSSPTTGEALWEWIRFHTGTASVHDMLLVVDYP
ncbi:MAG: hypothetical protein KKI08_08800, partial [Armatimonadetes bacterium]|nr:hypothetical protein [Armatimonadota bacterium]